MGHELRFYKLKFEWIQAAICSSSYVRWEGGNSIPGFPRTHVEMFLEQDTESHVASDLSVC